LAGALRRAAHAAVVQPAQSQHDSNTHDDWFLDRAFVLVPIQKLAAKFLITMKDYPPSQTPGSFNLAKVEEQIRAAAGGR
jgi:hypothetical protein